MRTIETTVYLFSELSDDAKENARNDFLSKGYENPYSGENLDSLKKFYDIFPVRQRGRNWGNFEMTCDDDISELSGIRLLKYIWNNYRGDLFKGKYYSTSGKWIDGKYHYKCKHSKIQLDHCCVLTGYCMDDDILEPVYRFLNCPDDTTFKELLQDCVNAWEKAVEKDEEYYQSVEYFAEICESNEYEFTEDGELV